MKINTIKYVFIHFFDKVNLRRKRNNEDFEKIRNLKNDDEIIKALSWLTDNEITEFKQFTKNYNNSKNFEPFKKNFKLSILNYLEEQSVAVEDYERAAEIRDIKKNIT